jgi:hypothetical protein
MPAPGVHIVAPEAPLFDEARLAIAGFLARYSGGTRATYSADLRCSVSWCAECRLSAFDAKRGHLELWARTTGPPQPRPARQLHRHCLRRRHKLKSYPQHGFRRHRAPSEVC